jgi:hypothetical protein
MTRTRDAAMPTTRLRLALRLSSLALFGLLGCLTATTGCQRSVANLQANLTLATESDDSSSPGLTLKEEEREYLWQIEHSGNLLVKYGFGAFKQALIRADDTALAALLAHDFTGTLVEHPRQVSVRNDLLHVVRLQETGSLCQTVDAEHFVEQLLTYRRSFPQSPKVAFNLMKLTPEEQGNLLSRYWRGSCLLRLWGESAPGRPAEIVLTLEYRVERPTEANLRKNGWLHSAAIVQTLTGNAKQFLLRDVTRECGIDPTLFYDNWLTVQKNPVHGGAYLCDFDRDGILDLLITDTNGYFLYKGLPGGKFVDVTERMGLPRVPVEPVPCANVAAFVDLDGDGWEDLILGNHIFRNDEGKRFLDYTYRSNLRFAIDAGGIIPADYDRDGRLDLYITRSGLQKKDSWLGGKSGDRRGNQLWRNKGNWQFEDVTDASGTSGGLRSTFTALWLDANNDGWPDLYVINEFGNGVLLVNNGDGTFHEHQLADGPNDFGTMGATCGDIDNDGNIDIYAANMYSKAGSRVISNLKQESYTPEIMAKMRQFVAGSQLWQNKGKLQFEKLGQRCQVAGVGWAYGAALVDLDNDGWLDLYATAGYMSSSRTEPDG